MTGEWTLMSARADFTARLAGFMSLVWKAPLTGKPLYRRKPKSLEFLLINSKAYK